ncbi:hypothetical protein BDV95DRAFT_608171 [Massariosphaeria phaeospora]|uniref:Uncharacterized protein n=1 Tax=Massariosphaeria phaeospora TaxID=100035 RepID=A0A7C8M6G3_9PLEO|nr:hypothetical protein BDV95DRAFT_608171 [Massariosphaeria phaeospora]
MVISLEVLELAAVATKPIQLPNLAEPSAIREERRETDLEVERIITKRRYVPGDNARFIHFRTLRRNQINFTQREDIVIDSYAKLACRRFCHQVYTSLPREVRDMVYEHLVTPNTVIEMYDSDHCYSRMCKGRDLFTLPIFSCGLTSRYNSEGSQHATLFTFTGMEVAQELAEFYYQSLILKVPSGHKITDLALMPEMWRVGLKPQDLINNFSFKIHKGDLVYTEWNNKSRIHRQHTDWTEVLQVEKLFQLKSGANILMTLRSDLVVKYHPWSKDGISTYWDGGKTVVACLAVMFPVLCRLIEAGYRIKVAIVNRGPEARIGPSPCSATSIAMQIFQANPGLYPESELERMSNTVQILSTNYAYELSEN